MPFLLRRRRLRSRDLAPGRYLTDGRRLLRVVSRLVDDRSVLVVVEDCLTLDVLAYAPVELEPMGLRPVRSSTRPAAGDASPGSSAAAGKPGDADPPAVARPPAVA
jgi:hypothetical protein